MFKRFPILVLSLIVILMLTLGVNTFANCYACHDRDIQNDGNEGLGNAAVVTAFYNNTSGIQPVFIAFLTTKATLAADVYAAEKAGFQGFQMFEVKIGLYDKNSPCITTCSIFKDSYDVTAALTNEKPNAPGTTQNRSLTNNNLMELKELTTLGIKDANTTAILVKDKGGAEKLLLFNGSSLEDVRLSANGLRINGTQAAVTEAGLVVSHIDVV